MPIRVLLALVSQPLILLDQAGHLENAAYTQLVAHSKAKKCRLLATNQLARSVILRQKLPCLCLLDLSAALDTIDHDIYSLGSHPGLAFMALFSTGLSPTSHLAPSV